LFISCQSRSFHDFAGTSRDRNEKAYLAGENYSPVVTAHDANPYLNQLLALEWGVLQPNSAYVGWAPPVAAVRAPARKLDASDLRIVLRAIKSRRMIEITYQSMNQPAPAARTVSPHAIAFDGSRWHIRAYCHQRQDYRDFVFARILEITLGESSPIDPATDSVWQREIEAVIEPHPTLPPAHRRAVELDYGMTDGRLVLKTREALLLYVLRRMALLHEFDEPAPRKVISSSPAGTSAVPVWDQSRTTGESTDRSYRPYRVSWQDQQERKGAIQYSNPQNDRYAQWHPQAERLACEVDGHRDVCYQQEREMHSDESGASPTQRGSGHG